MVINNKYNIGDKVLCVRNGRIEQIVIGNFSLDWNKSKTLDERLQYEEERKLEGFSFGTFRKTTFHESELCAKQENEHNALQDAKWNMKLHKFLNTL